MPSLNEKYHVFREMVKVKGFSSYVGMEATQVNVNSVDAVEYEKDRLHRLKQISSHYLQGFVIAD